MKIFFSRSFRFQCCRDISKSITEEMYASQVKEKWKLLSNHFNFRSKTIIAFYQSQITNIFQYIMASAGRWYICSARTTAQLIHLHTKDNSIANICWWCICIIQIGNFYWTFMNLIWENLIILLEDWMT